MTEEGALREALPWKLFTIGLALEGIIGLGGFAWALFGQGHNLLIELLDRFKPEEAAMGAAYGLAAAVIIWLAVSVIKPLQRSRSIEVISFLKRASWTQAVLLSAIAGVAEELFFRGAVQPVAGVEVAAVLFGLLHPYSRLYIIIAALAGFGLGYLYHATGSLLSPIAAHSLYDFAVIALLKLGLFPEVMEKTSPGSAQSDEPPADVE